MNVTDTRHEMLACVTALRERLRSESDPTERSALVESARRKIQRLQKRFKRSIDKRASERFGFPVNAREGIEQKLAEATTEALEQLDQAASGATATEDAHDAPSSSSKHR